VVIRQERRREKGLESVIPLSQRGGGGRELSKTANRKKKNRNQGVTKKRKRDFCQRYFQKKKGRPRLSEKKGRLQGKRNRVEDLLLVDRKKKKDGFYVKGKH